METAGKQIDDEELRELMKDNGIGRPSTRANIIETLFRRTYIKKERKNLIATPMGISLIQTIQNDLLKSAELTGQWEFKLRQIEKGEYEAKKFLEEMKAMINVLVDQVKHETDRPILKTIPSPITNNNSVFICPKCKIGAIVKGKTAMGCNRFKEGCLFKVPFEIMNLKLTEEQVEHFIRNGKTKKMTFNKEGKKQPGYLEFDSDLQIVFHKSDSKVTRKKNIKNVTVGMICPKCKVGTVVKGSTAYGCSLWKTGCGFRILFSDVPKETD
jgi:DNA topoisomerase-3